MPPCPAAIPPPDVWRIQPLSALPPLSRLTGSITIDGRTQTTLAGDLNPFGPEIVLDGNGLAANGLTITSNNHGIYGLDIERFGAGISILGGDSNTIAGNYIGVNPTGTAAAGNIQFGVLLASGASKNLIGTNADGVSDGAERNVISGNAGTGIAIAGTGSDSNIIAGNFIGTNATATAPVANTSNGISVFDGAQRNRIGTNADGTHDDAETNVIAGNGASGVTIIGRRIAKQCGRGKLHWHQ